MASVSNRSYPWRESQQIGPIGIVGATYVTGSTTVSGSTVQGELQSRAGSISGSFLTYKGYTLMEGFRTSGSVLSGSILRWDATNDNCVSGASSDLPTGVIGVALEAAAANGLVRVITHGVTPKICIASGAITAGDMLGAAGLSGSNCVGPATAVGTVIGFAIADIATAATGSIFVSPR